MTIWPEFSKIEHEADNKLILVNSYAILEIKGDDTVKFLQGQCSADVNSMSAGESLPGAICTVKGRVITSFIATKTNEAILLLMPRELVSSTTEYLKKYAAFYKVELNQWLHPCAIANTEGANLPEELYIPCNFQFGDTEFHTGLLNQTQSESLIELLQSPKSSSIKLRPLARQLVNGRLAIA